MGAPPPLPPPPPLPAEPEPGEAAEEGASFSQALVPAPVREEEPAAMVLSAPIARLPVELDVAVPVRQFRVRSLLALEPGQLIETQWANGEDLPLASGSVQLAWSEFEVIDSQLAVRITRLV